MGWLICFLISLPCYYAIFFKVQEYEYRKVDEKDWNSDWQWFLVGKLKYPLWVWVIGVLVLLIPIINVGIFIVSLIPFLIGIEDVYGRTKYQIKCKFFDLLSKRY